MQRVKIKSNSVRPLFPCFLNEGVSGLFHLSQQIKPLIYYPASSIKYFVLKVLEQYLGNVYYIS